MMWEGNILFYGMQIFNFGNSNFPGDIVLGGCDRSR